MATVINPDQDLLVINGEVNATSGDINLLKVKIDSTDDIDLNDIPASYSESDSALNVAGGAYIGGNLYTGGTFVANGDVVTLGNTGGSLTFNSNISSDVLPSTTNTYTIGSNSYQWSNVHTSSLNLESSPQIITNTTHTETASICYVDNTSPAIVNLQDGSEGQLLTIVCNAVTSVQISPVNTNGYTSVTFTSAGDTATLMFTGGSWAIISLFRASAS